jgi:hypothetical protein
LSALNTFPSVYEVSLLTKGTKALRAGWRGRWWRRRGLLLLRLLLLRLLLLLGLELELELELHLLLGLLLPEGHRGVVGRVYHRRY